MKLRELTTAVLAAALLTLGTANVASATDCWSDCSMFFGESFYTGGGWYDDAGNYVTEGTYGLSGCYNDGESTWCVYQEQ